MFLKKCRHKDLCSTCRTGYETYKTDAKEMFCPYLYTFRKNKCAFYKPLKKEEKD